MSIKKLFHHYPNIIIGTLAVVLLGVLIAFYSWAISDVFVQLHSALATPPAQNAEGFDLSRAAKLDLRGLMGSAPVTTATVTTGTTAQ